eukprot:48380-Rhodomonas_salina.2
MSRPMTSLRPPRSLDLALLPNGNAIPETPGRASSSAFTPRATSSAPTLNLVRLLLLTSLSDLCGVWIVEDVRELVSMWLLAMPWREVEAAFGAGKSVVTSLLHDVQC